MDHFQNLESRVALVEKRNNKVETDKAWENSWTRKLLIIIFTYLAIALYLKFFVRIDPWINAVVPSTGFLLSTLTLPYLKQLWAKYIYRKSKISD